MKNSVVFDELWALRNRINEQCTRNRIDFHRLSLQCEHYDSARCTHFRCRAKDSLSLNKNCETKNCPILN